MDERTWILKLADGSEIAGLTLNGTNFVSASEIDESALENNCEPCTFKADDGETKTFEHGIFGGQFKGHEDGKYYFYIREKSDEEITNENLQAQLDYLAMMTGTEL